MIVKLLTEYHLEFLSLTEGCRGSFKSTLAKMPNCWKSHAAAQIVYTCKNCPTWISLYFWLQRFSSIFESTVHDILNYFKVLACNRQLEMSTFILMVERINLAAILKLQRISYISSMETSKVAISYPMYVNQPFTTPFFLFIHDFFFCNSVETFVVRIFL